jgi:acyl-CoA synthetase (AMP-forming)/AMP-acid ligase II
VLWYPRDVEEAFCAIDGVTQAAVVGVADPVHGQRPHAFITLLPERAFTPEWLKSAISGKVAYDLSALQVNVVSDLPMTPTGKIAKAELVARLARTP